MRKIIHMSDLHIGHERCGDSFKTIVDRISFLCKPVDDYVIVITGDLVDDANHRNFVDEAAEAVERLEENGFRVLLVPGNHDYGTGVVANEKFVEIFKQRFFKTGNIQYPKLDIIDDMAFIGLDSSAEELHWHDRFMSEGELGREQLDRLAKILDDPEMASKKKIVYLHHHPFDYKLVMQLKDSDKLKSVISNKIDLILFGHYHNSASAVLKELHGTWGIPRCYNAGSSTHKNNDLGYQWVIDLSFEENDKDYDANLI